MSLFFFVLVMVFGQGKETRSQQGVLLEEHLKQHYSSSKRKWIILFPEGGFLRKRREASQEWVVKDGKMVKLSVSFIKVCKMLSFECG